MADTPTSGADIIYGTPGNDRIDGLQGDDVVFGLGGDDQLDGGAGSDTLYGGNGNDRLADLVAEAGTVSELFGEDGNDELRASSGSARLFGGSGNDRLTYDGRGDGPVELFGDAGDDRLENNRDGAARLDGGDGNDRLDGGSGQDDLDGGNGTDTLTGGDGPDGFWGGLAALNGDIIVDYELGERIVITDATLASSGQVTLAPNGLGTDIVIRPDAPGSAPTRINLAKFTGGGELVVGRLFSGGDGFDTIRIVAKASATTRADVIAGSSQSESIDGLAGSDEIFGQGGNDTLTGGDGFDTLYGGAGNDILRDSGQFGDNVFFGDDGDDRLTSSAGMDAVMDGGRGNDTLGAGGGGGFAILKGGDGNDSVTYSGTGQSQLFGGAGSDSLNGSTGDDTLEGGAGADRLLGGGGNDVFVASVPDLNGDVIGAYQLGQKIVVGQADRVSIVSDPSDPAASIVTVGLGDATSTFSVRGTSPTSRAFLTGEEGEDKVLRIVSEVSPLTNGDDLFFGQPNQPSVILSGGGNDEIYTFRSATSIEGGEGNDSVFGGQGGDVIRGGQGDDRLLGKGGNDSLFGNEGSDQLFGGAGNDRLIDDESGNQVQSAGAYLDGGDGNDTLSGSGAFNAALYGGAGDDTLAYESGRFSAYLDGGQGNDRVTAGAGNDELSGGSGNDTMTGGAGADIFRDALAGLDGDVVTDFATEDAIVLAESLGSAAQVRVVQSANEVDALVSIDGDADGSFETAITLKNVTAGAVTVTGQDGRLDTIKVAVAPSPVTFAVAPASGTEGAGVAFTLTRNGFSGETRSVTAATVASSGTATAGADYTAASQTFTFLAGETTKTFVVGTNQDGAFEGDETFTVELLNPTNGAIISSRMGSATGTIIDGNLVRAGGSGDDSLVGGSANDSLNGAAGNDTLDGRAGVDTMVGGVGDDLFIVDNGGDVVVEFVGQGSDTVRSSVVYSLAGQHVETLILTGTDTIGGTGNSLANLITGNGASNVLNGGVFNGVSGNDTLDGGAGADTLIGGGGDDLYVVDTGLDRVIEAVGDGTDTVRSSATFSLAGTHVENLVLTGTAASDATGNSFANLITGNGAGNVLNGGDFNGLSGNDTLDGGLGADTLIGGTGDDVYVVDDAGDVVSDLFGQGADTVRSSVSFSFAGRQLETLILTGAGAIDGTGNSFANLITGNGAGNLLNGGDFNGVSGNDTLDGGAGADTLIGGTGDDLFTVDDAGDVVIEAAGQGSDTVRSSVAFSLAGQHVETLVLTGTDTIGGTGNSLANLITGNAAGNVLDGGAFNGVSGNDTLDGGLGADTLAGGQGQDLYRFRAALGAGNVDLITDFRAGDDTVALSAAIFGLPAGALSANAFRDIGAAAPDADDRILYDSTDGGLFLDSDGSGAAAAIRFATLTTRPTDITAADFVVV